MMLNKTGTGHYAGVVYGTGVNSAADLRYDVTGTSSVDVNFSASTFSGALAMAGTAQGGATVNFGSYGFDGQMVGGNTDLNGSFNNAGQSNGAISAQFYGPDGSELAGTFYLNTPAGAAGGQTSITGALAAVRK